VLKSAAAVVIARRLLELRFEQCCAVLLSLSLSCGAVAVLFIDLLCGIIAGLTPGLR
jgi:hypothetical protein